MWNKEEWLVFLFSLFILALFTKTAPSSPNDLSRLAAIQSVAENQTFVIDNSQYADTIDKVFINGHFYSDKPPLSYLLGVPVYWILHKAGFTPKTGLVYYLVTLSSIGLIVSIMLVYFFRSLAYYGLNSQAKLFYVVSLGFGTLLFTYSVVINNHAPAAAFLFLTFYFILKEKANYILVGFFAGMLASIDLVAGNIFLMLFILLIVIRKSYKQLWFFLLGASVPIIVHLWINWSISGSLVPFSIRPELFNYPGTFWKKGIPIVMLPLSRIPGYALGILFGKQGGFLSYTPVLFFALAALIYAAIKPNTYRKESIIVCIGTFCTFLFYLFRTSHYDGCAQGYRYGVTLIPLLYFFIPALFKLKNDKMVFVLQALFIIVVLLSAYYSFELITNVWSCKTGFALHGPFSCIMKPII